MIEKIPFDEFLSKFKGLSGAKTELEVAKILNIKQSTFSVRKKTGEVPYKELINFLIEKGVSLDLFFKGETHPAPSPYPQEVQRFLDKVAAILQGPNKKLSWKLEERIDRDFEDLQKEIEGTGHLAPTGTGQKGGS